jgi:DNA-binding GntR family transcriptional regulator
MKVVDGAASDRPMPIVVADRLRADILDGTIGPGERINVRRLGHRLDVSHIPIREAVRLLEAEGLVETKPNVGAVAAGVSLTELEDVYELRRTIEPAVAARAVKTMSDEDVLRLRTVLGELESCELGADGIDGNVIIAHRRFHWELLAPAASPLIERTLHGLWRVSDRYVWLTRGTALPIADLQHELMVDLCERRDGDALAELLNEHLHLTGNTLKALYSQDVDT